MIYFCESAKWKRLTNAGRARLAAQLEWNLQKHHGDAWMSGYTNAAVVLKTGKRTGRPLIGLAKAVVLKTGKTTGRPLIGLAKAVLRLRLTKHPEDMHYDMDGLLQVLQARCILGVLEHRLREYSIQVQVKAKHCIQDTSKLQFLSRIVDTWADRGMCEEPYRHLLKVLIKSCAKKDLKVQVSAEVFRSIPGLGLTSCSKSTLMKQYMDRVPDTLATAPVHKQKCWHCKEIVLVTQKCGSCKRARYCSRLCQKNGWEEHKPACKAIAGFLTQELMMHVHACEVHQDDTWKSILRKHMSGCKEVQRQQDTADRWESYVHEQLRAAHA